MKKTFALTLLLSVVLCLLCVVSSSAIGVATSKDKADSAFIGTEYTIEFKRAGVENWFKLSTTSTNSIYRFYIDNISVETSIILSVYENKYDAFVGEVKAGYSANNYVDFYLNSGKTYYIKISRSNAERLGYYRFSVDAMRCDAGITKDTSYAIDLNTPYDKNLDAKNYDDWFQFKTSSKDAVYRISLINLGVPGTVIPTVYESKYNRELGSVKVGVGAEGYMDFELDPDSVYFLKIARSKPAEHYGAYQVWVEEILLDAGTRSEKATAMDLNTVYYKNHNTIKSQAWYKFTTSANYSNYRVVFDNMGIACRTTMNVYHGDGLTLVKSAYADKGAQAIVDFSPAKHILPATNQTFYICIERAKEGNYGEYTIEVTEYLADAAYRMEDAINFPLSVNTVYTQRFDITGSEEWFSFTPEIDMNITPSVTNANIDTTVNMDVLTYVSGSKELSASLLTLEAGTGATATPKEEFHLKAGTDYLIRISRSKNTNLGIYSFVLGASGVNPEYASSTATAPIHLFINQREIHCDQPPVIINGRTLVPMRAIFEALTATVEWDDATRTVTSVRGGTVIQLTIGSDTAFVNSLPNTLDVPAQIISGRTMVPVRFIAESVGASVDWDGVSRSVYITLN